MGTTPRTASRGDGVGDEVLARLMAISSGRVKEA
jgi:hypothetical protein